MICARVRHAPTSAGLRQREHEQHERERFEQEQQRSPRQPQAAIASRALRRRAPAREPGSGPRGRPCCDRAGAARQAAPVPPGRPAPSRCRTSSVRSPGAGPELVRAAEVVAHERLRPDRAACSESAGSASRRSGRCRPLGASGALRARLSAAAVGGLGDSTVTGFARGARRETGLQREAGVPGAEVGRECRPERCRTPRGAGVLASWRRGSAGATAGIAIPRWQPARRAQTGDPAPRPPARRHSASCRSAPGERQPPTGRSRLRKAWRQRSRRCADPSPAPFEPGLPLPEPGAAIMREPGCF